MVEDGEGDVEDESEDIDTGCIRGGEQGSQFFWLLFRRS
jgi:hypothetical protein